MSNCDYCKYHATYFEVEWNLFGEPSESAKACPKHFSNICEDYVDGNYIERLRYKSDNTLFLTLTKEQARKFIR